LLPDRSIHLLRELVAIDSVNPSLVAGGAGEGNIAQLIASTMRRAGLDTEVREVAPGRPNVIGVLQGRTAGRSLMFCGHTDTVGVFGMTNPFDPVMRDDRIYGRGAQDMKGGLAAILSAAGRLAMNGGLESGQLIVAAVADEEYESLGAESLIRNWHADAAIVTEPTDLVIGVGHKGFTWIEVTTEGRAAHGSRPQDGRDAILFMSRVLARLERLDRELQTATPHSIQGTGSLHASLINGGRELSSYPDRCVLHFERRTTSNEDPGTALQEVNRLIDELRSEDSEFQASAKLLFERQAFETPKWSEFPGTLEEAIRQVGCNPRRGGVSFWTDAGLLATASIPTVVFGPGGQGLHSPEEFVHVPEVIACRDALIEVARRFC
jgi:acetylornithine deacetylase